MKAIGLVIFAMLMFACGQQETGTYTVEEVDGVKFIRNHSPAWGKSPKVKIEHVVTFGGLDENDDNHIMFNIWDVCSDKDNNIYVVDSGSRRIQVFNSGGKFLRTIGRRGQGPGEFGKPVNLNIDKNGRLIVGDSRKYSFIVFSPNGEEIDRFKIDRRESGMLVPPCRLLTDDLLIIGGFTQGTSNPETYKQYENSGYYKLLHVLDLHGKPKCMFGEVDILDEKVELLHSASSFFDTDLNGFVYVAHRYQNRIEKWDKDGNLIFAAGRPIPYKETGYQFDFWQETYSNSISSGLALDGRNRIWVVTLKKQPELWQETWEEWERQKVEQDWAVFELFTAEGVLLGELPLPQDLFGVRIFNGRMYVIGKDRVSVSVYQIIELE